MSRSRSQSASSTPSNLKCEDHTLYINCESDELQNSKNQSDFWKKKRAEKKARKRERTAANREEQRSKWEALSEEEKQALRDRALIFHAERQKNKDAQAAITKKNLENPDTPIVVFDLAFWNTMTEVGKKSTVAQLKFSYSSLKKANFCLRPIFTSFDESEPLLKELKEYEGFKLARPLFFSAPLCDVFSGQNSLNSLPSSAGSCDLKKVVYLSADSNNILTTIEDGKAYVIGAFVDHNSQKGATEKSATSLGVTTARLPIVETLVDIGNLCKVLTINHVTDCLTIFKNTNSWEQAFSSLPTRRRASKSTAHTPVESSMTRDAECVLPVDVETLKTSEILGGETK